MGNSAGADSTDESSTFLDQTSAFGLEADHKACHVVEENDWDSAECIVSDLEHNKPRMRVLMVARNYLPLVAKVNELGGLIGLGRIDDRLLIGDEAGQVAWNVSVDELELKTVMITMNMSPSGDHHFPERWFE